MNKLSNTGKNTDYTDSAIGCDSRNTSVGGGNRIRQCF